MLQFEQKPPKFCSECGVSLVEDLKKSGIVEDFDGSNPIGFVAHEPETEHVNEDATVMPTGGPVVPKDPGVVGRQIGNFRLIKQLGAGGMGVVWEAEEVKSKRLVAIKLLAKSMMSDESTVERFIREGRLAARLVHPKSTFVYQAGAHDGQPFIVMELMPGDTLQDLLSEGQDIPQTKAVDYILDVIEGLIAAHEIGFIHRDVKPSNCFMDGEGGVKVGDFGLSKSLMVDSSLTRTGTFMGTPLYAAPEQIRGESVDHQTDIYSVAATLFHLLCGRPPFEGDAMSVTAQIITDDAPDIREFNPKIPIGLGHILRTALSKKPEDRFESLSEFRVALLPYATGGSSLVDLGRRFSAYMIDAVGVAILCTLLSSLSGFYYTFSGTMKPGEYPKELPMLSLISSIVIWIAPFIYFSILEGFWGRTIGKRLMGLKVVNRLGEVPGIVSAALRSILVPSLVFLPLIPAFVRFYNFDSSKVVEAMIAELISRLLFTVAPAVLLVTMTSKNGFRGIHELLSGTWTVRTISDTALAFWKKVQPFEGEKLDSTEGLSFGPFHALKQMSPKGNDVKIFKADDPNLEREVWVVNRLFTSDQRKSLCRQTRPRWIDSSEYHDNNQGEDWEAFEAIDGSPLGHVLQQLGQQINWERGVDILRQTVDEVRESLHDGTLPKAIALDSLWISKRGDVKILDLLSKPDEAVFVADQTDELERAGRFIEYLISTLQGSQVLPLSMAEAKKEFCESPFSQQSFSKLSDCLHDPMKGNKILRWDDRLGVFAITLGLQVSFYFLICLLVGAATWNMTYSFTAHFSAAMVVLILPALSGFYIKNGSPIFRLLGIHVRNKDGRESHRYQRTIRNLISWAPLCLYMFGFVAVLILGQRMSDTSKVTITPQTETVSEKVEAEVAQARAKEVLQKLSPFEILLTFAMFLLMPPLMLIGAILGVVYPERGVQDLLCGTRLMLE